MQFVARFKDVIKTVVAVVSDWLGVRRTLHQRRVLEFNDKCFIPHPAIPSVPCVQLTISRARIVAEEFFELMEAMGVDLILDGQFRSNNTITMSDIKFVPVLSFEPDLPHLAKECADLHVVTTGTELVYGIDLAPIQDAVDLNNLGKFKAGGYIDENGKLRKPNGYQPPDVASLLKRQGWVPSKENK